MTVGITSKWTAREVELIDDLMSKTGAVSRSHLLRIALLELAQQQEVKRALLRDAVASRGHLRKRVRQIPLALPKAYVTPSKLKQTGS